MTLRETELAKGSEKVCFGDASVYRFLLTTRGSGSNAGTVWLFLAFFKLLLKPLMFPSPGSYLARRLCPSSRHNA